MMKKCVLILSDESETLLLGSLLAKICIMNCVIYLNGYVGTGKTTFCRGFLKALGYVNHVKSPTYTFVESYHLSGRYIYHIDCYRIRSEEGLLCMDIIDDLDEKSIFLVEWPLDRSTNTLPNPDIIITIDYGSHSESRRVMIESITNSGIVIVNNLLCIKNLRYEINV